MMSNDRTAIVTGAARGIGAEIARQLAQDGFQVVINYSRSAADAEKVANTIRENGGRALVAQGDVSSAADMARLFDEAEAHFGIVDVLVNNAGVTKMGMLAQVSDEDFNNIMAVNLTGAFHGMREGANRIRDNGRIINLSTSIIGNYIPACGLYAASKAAVEAMTHTLAKELGPRGVTVNAVAPGPVGTELLFKERSQEMIDRLIRDIPMGRLGEPDDIAKVVSFLAGPQSSWVSGQVIKANGGRN
ncbi:SDR family oxidoreductase [Hahella sp. HN01]|uniref:SDR family oxidoreductase n=1 Tax=Hahella sp. HN01 TaxID=2847262 RepID=UPI0020A69392|nr:SDR family oxidoreductase [Hahella sp. HN01]